MSRKYTDRQTKKITRKNERIRVLRPKSHILKVPFPFPFFVSVSVSMSVSSSISVVRGIALYGICKSYDFEI